MILNGLPWKQDHSVVFEFASKYCILDSFVDYDGCSIFSTDRMWSTGEGNGKPLQYFCLENPMNSMKRQNDRILRRNFLGQYVASMLLEISGEITPERMKAWSQSKNNTQLWM